MTGDVARWLIVRVGPLVWSWASGSGWEVVGVELRWWVSNCGGWWWVVD